MGSIMLWDLCTLTETHIHLDEYTIKGRYEMSHLDSTIQK